MRFLLFIFASSKIDYRGLIVCNVKHCNFVCISYTFFFAIAYSFQIALMPKSKCASAIREIHFKKFNKFIFSDRKFPRRCMALGCDMFISLNSCYIWWHNNDMYARPIQCIKMREDFSSWRSLFFDVQLVIIAELDTS